MVWNAAHHHAVIDPQVVIAALTAAAFLYARFKVTPTADPKDGNGQPLAASPPPPVITVNATGSADIGRQVAAAMKAGGYLSRGTRASGPPPPPPATAPEEKTLQPPAGPE